MAYSLFIVVLSSILYRVMSVGKGCPSLRWDNHRWENNQPPDVDWFLIFKAGQVIGGKKYLYIDPITNGWEGLLDDLGDRFDPLFEAVKRINTHKNVIMYNDQYKNHGGRDTSAPSPHSKGFMGWTGNQGLFITHSTPNYPKVSRNGKIDATLVESSLKNGQHFLCITMNADNSEMLKEAVAFEHYAVKIGGFRFIKIDQHQIRIQRDLNPYTLGRYLGSIEAPESDIIDFKEMTVGRWSVISKHVPNYKASGSLYQRVMQDFDVALLIRTNTLSRDPQDNECGPNNFQPSRLVELNFLGGRSKFRQGADHSKWAISDGGDVCCFCDLNRKCGQRRRGGSCFCLHDQDLHDALNSLISQTQVVQCNSRSQCR